MRNPWAPARGQGVHRRGLWQGACDDGVIPRRRAHGNGIHKPHGPAGLLGILAVIVDVLDVRRLAARRRAVARALASLAAQDGDPEHEDGRTDHGESREHLHRRGRASAVSRGCHDGDSLVLLSRGRTDDIATRMPNARRPYRPTGRAESGLPYFSLPRSANGTPTRDNGTVCRGRPVMSLILCRVRSAGSSPRRTRSAQCSSVSIHPARTVTASESRERGSFSRRSAIRHPPERSDQPGPVGFEFRVDLLAVEGIHGPSIAPGYASAKVTAADLRRSRGHRGGPSRGGGRKPLVEDVDAGGATWHVAVPPRSTPRTDPGASRAARGIDATSRIAYKASRPSLSPFSGRSRA